LAQAIWVHGYACVRGRFRDNMARSRQLGLFRLLLLSGSLLQWISWLRGTCSFTYVPSTYSSSADARQLRLAGQVRCGRVPIRSSAKDEAPMGDDEFKKMMENPIIEPQVVAGQFIPACVAAAIVQGKNDEAMELVEKGAPLEDRGAREISALGFAAERGDLEMVKFLVEKGAKMEAKDQSGRSVLTMAAIGGHPEVVQFLIDQGADMESRDRGQLTALLWASVSGHAEVVQALVKSGADIAVVDSDGMTALKLAAVFNKVDVARSLVEAGMDPKPGLAMAQKFPNCKETASFLSAQVSE